MTPTPTTIGAERASPPLSAHGRSLVAALRRSDDRLAVFVVPTAAAAADLGVTPGEYLAARAGLLASVGTAVDELRAAGWRLHVESLTGDRVPHPGAERVVVVTHLEPDAGSHHHPKEQ